MFWCLARQLVIYYLIPIVPLFAVWCAGYFKRRGIPLRRLALWAAGIAGAYAILTFPLGCYLSRMRSTEEVVEQVLANRERPMPRIVFVHRMPYSAYFYARDHVIPHGKESIRTSIERTLESQIFCVLICLKRYSDRVPASLSPRLRVVRKIGNWLVLEPKQPCVGRTIAGGPVLPVGVSSACRHGKSITGGRG